MSASAWRFDEQAETFDFRAGLPEHVPQQVAHAIMQLVQPAPGDVVVDLGAGTGEIGHRLACLPVRYIGLDLSLPVLRVFLQRTIPGTRSGLLVQADANRVWPLADRSVRVLFSSRAAHLFSEEQLVTEIFRVAADRGAVFLVGRTRRERDSVSERMRRQMWQILEQRGIAARKGESQQRAILEACSKKGATPIDSWTAAHWPVRHTPRQSIESWQQKSGLAGGALSDTTKHEVLEQLQRWAIATFGSLDREILAEERYVLAGVWLPRS